MGALPLRAVSLVERERAGDEGIGRATCLRLAKDGVASGKPTMIGALDIGSSAALDKVLTDIASLGAQAVPLLVDLTTPDAPEIAVREALDAGYWFCGGLDALVSAGDLMLWLVTRGESPK